MAYLGEVQVAQAREFAEFALEGEEGKERNQARAEGRKRARGVRHDLLERKENRSGSWKGERTALRRREVLKRKRPGDVKKKFFLRKKDLFEGTQPSGLG